MRKIFLLILAMVMLVTGVQPAFAYTAGEKSVDVDLTDYESLQQATMANSVLDITGGGRAVYQLYIPFDAVSVSFKATIHTDGTKMQMLVDSQEKTFSFSSEATVTFDNVVRRGEHKIILIPDNNVTIYKITFNKYNRSIGSAIQDYTTSPALTDFEKAIQTAFIFSEKSPVMMVNGGKRYVNNDDYREVPYVENGEMYLPLHSFSRAFGYYYEEKPELGELVLMKENVVYLLKNGVMTKQTNFEDPIQIENIVKTVNGKTYLPIRYFAECDGKTVMQRDDIYVVEYPSVARDILKDDVFTELASKYSAYYLDSTAGKTYYVSKDCVACDNNNGSYERPFKTIAKASEVAQAGDTIIIGEGTYYEVLTPQNDGTATAPITYKAAEGAKVLLSACAEMGEPVGTEGDMLIYDLLTDLGDGRNQIFYKQTNLVAGRHPNTDTIGDVAPKKADLSPEWPTRGNIILTKESSKVAASTTDLDQEEGYWNGATFVGFKGSAWVLEMAKVESSEPGKLYLTDVSKQWWHSVGSGHVDDYAYLTDHKNTIDLPGEWAVDNGKLYILPPEGETAETLKLEQKVRQVVMDMADRKFIRIEGIDTYGGGVRMNNSEMCMLRDGTYRYISHYSHSMDQREGYIDKWDLYNPNGAPQRGEVGFYVGGSDNIIINNTFSYSAASAIYSVGRYEYIENNYVHDCGYMASYVGGIFIATEGWLEPDTPRGGNAVFQNTVVNAGRHVYGVCTHEAWYATNNGQSEKRLPSFLPDEVAYNDFFDGSLAARDTGPVYSYGCIMGTDRLWSKHHNNLVANSWSYQTIMSAGMYYDGYSSMVEIYDNVIFYTNPEIPYNRDLYRQDLNSAMSITDEWNNSIVGLKEGGKESLTVNDYPSGKKFRSGADTVCTDFTPYLDSIDEERDMMLARNAEASSGAKIENGIFKPEKTGDYICFKDVDFSEGQNYISLFALGDKYNTDESVSVIIGDSIDNGYVEQMMNVNIAAPYDWARQIISTPIIGYVPKGKTNVYVRADDFKSFNLERIALSVRESEYSNVRLGLYGVHGNIEGGSIKPSGLMPAGETYQYLNTTGGGSVLSFKGVELKEACNEFFVRISSAGANMGQIVQLRIGSATGEIVAEIPETNTNWEDYTMTHTPCYRTIEPGTYDFYLTFTPSSKTSNFFWFGLGVSDSGESADEETTEETTEEVVEENADETTADETTGEATEGAEASDN
ncbi:MAG: carbohydrate-binding protein [Clostridia bacterium]|nr:carbohydrate-binding protein [Clostridia bacterium]